MRSVQFYLLKIGITKKSEQRKCSDLNVNHCSVLIVNQQRVSANYKLAIPQYYEGKIQLLLPLCLMSDNKPDIAIAVTKKNGCYQGHTCLTLDMAYNNARLIAKPESNWLSQ